MRTSKRISLRSKENLKYNKSKFYIFGLKPRKDSGLFKFFDTELKRLVFRRHATKFLKLKERFPADFDIDSYDFFSIFPVILKIDKIGL